MNNLYSIVAVCVVLSLTYCTGYQVSNKLILGDQEAEQSSSVNIASSNLVNTEINSQINSKNGFIARFFSKNTSDYANSSEKVDVALDKKDAAYYASLAAKENSTLKKLKNLFFNSSEEADYDEAELLILDSAEPNEKDYASLKAEMEAQKAAAKAKKIEAKIKSEVYGFNANEYTIYSGKIKRNQFLSQILTKHNVEYATVAKLAHKAKPIFDVKKLNYNKPYKILTKKGEKTPRYFVYDPSEYYYVIYDLQGETNAKVVNRKITKKLREASGVIYSSLYETMMKNKLSPLLVNELADVYAWSIDFYHIQKNDKFKVIFEEEFIDGEAVGIGKIRAAIFDHKGEKFYAFKYEQDDLDDYYDEKGKSLRKQFLKAPLKYSRISSRYSGRRYHPVLKRYKSHLGTDYAAPKGTPIRAVGDGTIETAGYKKYNGNWVKIKHNKTYSTGYLHMTKVAKGIKKGKKVKQGDIIGYVGSTGLATGPHLCFRFWKNGVQVDPFKQKLPPSDPIKSSEMKAYQKHLKDLKPKLDGIGFE